MTLHNHTELEQGSDQWLAARRGIVTASVIGALITPTLKVADNETSRGLTLTLTAERITGRSDPAHVTPDMMRGTMDEPIARHLYGEHFAPVTETGFMLREEPDWKLGFSPDGLVGEDGMIEVKSRRPKKHLATIISDSVPSENMAQIQCGLLVSGREWCDYISYAGGMPMWVKRVLPNERWFEVIFAAVEKFEGDVARTIETFDTATRGMPPTEWVDHFGDEGITV